jgi:hypothetical protein
MGGTQARRFSDKAVILRALLRMRTLVALLLLAGCTVQPATVPPPASTPPPPDRPENAAVATGTVMDAGGRPVANARVRVWAADAACNPIGRPEQHVTGDNGTYQLRVASSVGPQYDACIVVEAAAAGAVMRAQSPVHYAPDTVGGNVARMDLQLPPATLLTRAEADRLIEVIRHAMQGEQDAVEELRLYGNPNIAPISQYTRGFDSVRVVTEGDRRYTYEVTGRRPGRTIQITIWQDAITHIELPEVQN